MKRQNALHGERKVDGATAPIRHYDEEDNTRDGLPYSTEITKADWEISKSRGVGREGHQDRSAPAPYDRENRKSPAKRFS